MARFGVILKGQRETRRRVRQVARLFTSRAEWSQIAVRMAVPIARHELGRSIKTAFEKPSGKLESSYDITARADPQSGLEMSWESDADHARIHEKGGIIRPRKAQGPRGGRGTGRGKGKLGRGRRAGRYLHFKVGGKWVRTKRVKIRRKQYLTIAIRNARKKITAGIRIRQRRAHKRIAAGGR